MSRARAPSSAPAPSAASAPNADRAAGSAGGVSAARGRAGAATRSPAVARGSKRRLEWLARRPARPLRLRLIDAVALAAASLLLLKLAAFVSDAPAEPGAPMPEFARAIAKARTGYEPPDPTTTGSVSKEAKDKAEAAPDSKPAGAPPDPKPSEALPASDPLSPSERAILEKLATRRDSLKQRADQLDLREQLLDAAEKKLEGGVADLREAEGKADLNGAKRAEAERAGLKGIVTMYETMKPKDAARVFDRLGLDVLVPIVLGMNPRKMADVLALMGSEPAEKLTVALANRARGVESGPTPRGEAGLPPNELPALDPGPPARPAMP